MDYTLWLDKDIAGTALLPVVYIHSFRGNGEDVWKACHDAGCPQFALVSVNNPGTGLDDELSPWPAQNVWKGQAPYRGLAVEHLQWLSGQCIPEVESRIAAKAAAAIPATMPAASVATTIPAAAPSRSTFQEHDCLRQVRPLQLLPIIAGYSLAGLFALWAAWNSGYFRRVASVSGSLWYPGFTEYIRDNAPRTPLERAYFLLGDKESRTRHPLMGQVGTCTSTIVESVRSRCPDTIFEWNSGNHFDHPDLRMARAITRLLR